MKDYQIEKICHSAYNYVVLSTSYINPFDEKEEIENSLRKENYKGKILFDLLLKNGFNYNRYIEVVYDGDKFDINTMKALDNIDDQIKLFTTNFYKDHDYLLENSIIPKSKQFLIKRGIII